MTAQDDTWLDNLLAHPPRVDERNFTELTLTRIKTYQHRRRNVLISAWVLALAIVLLTSPWNTFVDWMQVLTVTEGGFLQGLKLSDISYDRAQLISLVREHWLIPLALVCVIIVVVKNAFVQEA